MQNPDPRQHPKPAFHHESGYRTLPRRRHHRRIHRIPKRTWISHYLWQSGIQARFCAHVYHHPVFDCHWAVCADPWSGKVVCKAFITHQIFYCHFHSGCFRGKCEDNANRCKNIVSIKGKKLEALKWTKTVSSCQSSDFYV